MNYSDYSDFEINKRVAELQPYTTVIGEGEYPSASEDAVHVEQRAFKHGNINELGVDYCNNPSDAWPIVEQIWSKLMSVTSYDYGVGVGESKTTIWDARMHMYGDSKLRSACIVYLMMQEG